MNYPVQLKPRALKDLAALSPENRRRIWAKLEKLQDNLAGDIKRLTNFTPEYRLRVGDYRVLFEIEDETIVIYRVKHRRNAYS